MEVRKRRNGSYLVWTSLHTVKAIQATNEGNGGIQQEKRSDGWEAQKLDSKLEELE